MDFSRIVHRLAQNPRKILDGARSNNKNDLTDLCNCWQEVPVMMSLGVLDVFFHHLDPHAVPDRPSTSDHSINRAYLSLVGLTKAGNFVGEDGSAYRRQFVKAWPGVFKWSQFFFTQTIQHSGASAERRKNATDVLSASWYSLCRDDVVRRVMAQTPGSVEIVTQLWMLEDIGPVPSVVDIPSASALLDAILRRCDKKMLDRVFRAAGGNASVVAKLAVMRLKAAIKPLEAIKATVYSDVINQLSRHSVHPLRYALLQAKAIKHVTESLLAASEVLNQTGNVNAVDTMVAGFTYLVNCIESTSGFFWVIESVKAGLLTAFVDCSPHFSKVDAEDSRMMVSLLEKLSRYLVYRSVIRAVDGTMGIVSQSPHRERVHDSIANDAWIDFFTLAKERLLVSIQATVLKGKASTCDNVDCQKVDDKNAFQKCSGCSTTLYCSKACQKAAWSEGHKTVCRLKQQEALEGKGHPISKQDVAFFHHLPIRDGRKKLPHLRAIAARDFPKIPVSELMIDIDYTVIPETYALIPLANYKQYAPDIDGSTNALARNDALIQRAKDNPGKYTLFNAKISNGQSCQLVTTVVKGTFWQAESGDMMYDDHFEDEFDNDVGDPTDLNSVAANRIDEVDLAMARNALNEFLGSLGQPPAF